MPAKEATARIKINKLLEAAGWRFFPDGDGPANVQLELHVTLKPADLDAFGEDFEKAGKGFVDFLLLDAKGFPLIVLEAKSEGKNPLVGKEQARKYARSQNCRFVMLSNGNLHYFWDLERGNPYVITTFPTPDSVTGYKQVTPNPQRLVEEHVAEDYIVLTLRPSYASDAAWKNEVERPGYIRANKLRFLRPYQLKAVQALQRAAKEGKDRFLFEMATGTGKTLTAAAVIKLFLRTGNARRVLFLVDRLELEDQAKKAFVELLSADFQTVIYKENRDDWRHAEIVVTTVQSLLVGNKYQNLFSPTDFDLVISDEAHRSIGGNARAVFDYFIGYKLGLTATPRDYLKRIERSGPGGRDPRELERRLLLDTYRTFGCENSQPTYRYSLLDGVKDGYLVNPAVVDARTEITTELLSEDGFIVSFRDDAGEDQQEAFRQREFEKRFFAEATNQLFCKTFLEHALRDPVTGEIGKSIIFSVSQNHAAKLTQILNQMADRMFPGRYQSNFAVQVTSQIPDAQKFTIKFANNNLLGSGNFLPAYTWSSGSTTPLLFLVGSVPLICSGTFWTGTAGGLGRLKAFGCFWLSPFEGEHMYGHRSEQYDLFELVRLERFARDQGDWSALVDSYWPTAVITTTWFRGSASDFAGESRKLYERGGRGKHTIDPVWARTQGDRALVESLGQILIRMPIAGVECDLTSWCRFFSRVRRGPHGWRLLSFDGIYVKDRLDPVLPNQPHPNLDWELLGRLRASYRFLSYLAHSQPGHSTDQELPGDDRPDLVQKFYREAEDWLSAVTQDATAS